MKKRIKIEKIIESKNNNDNNADYYYIVAVDIGKKNCVVCVTNKDGSTIVEEETKYDNTLHEAEERFAFYLDNKYDNSRTCHTVCESTANKYVVKSMKRLGNTIIDVKLKFYEDQKQLHKQKNEDR